MAARDVRACVPVRDRPGHHLNGWRYLRALTPPIGVVHRVKKNKKQT